MHHDPNLAALKKLLEITEMSVKTTDFLLNKEKQKNQFKV